MGESINGGIFRYLGALLAGAGTYLALSFLSNYANLDLNIFKYAALALTAGMIALVAPIGGKKAKLPPGSIATLAAMIAGAAIMVLNPFHSDDVPLYLVSLVILAAVVWESVDLLRLYNRACSNPVPQFASHTGGDDRA